jgi:threonine dehydrogenase-like Zn-dependent dehydrogenase
VNFNDLTGDYADAVREAVGQGFSHVMEATGSESALRAAYDLVY